MASRFEHHGAYPVFPRERQVIALSTATSPTLHSSTKVKEILRRRVRTQGRQSLKPSYFGSIVVQLSRALPRIRLHVHAHSSGWRASASGNAKVRNRPLLALYWATVLAAAQFKPSSTLEEGDVAVADCHHDKWSRFIPVRVGYISGDTILWENDPLTLRFSNHKWIPDSEPIWPDILSTTS